MIRVGEYRYRRRKRDTGRYPKVLAIGDRHGGSRKNVRV
jgi:hypothetical protein